MIYKNKSTFGFLILLLFLMDKVESFEYSDQEHWPEMYKGCAGQLQSPIDLSTQGAEIERDGSVISYFGYDIEFDLSNTKLFNDGHSVQLTGKPDTGDIPFIKNGSLPGNFVFNSLHFHWGSNEGFGSEHLIDHQQFSMEMHIVHVNRKYSSSQEALQHKDGIAVLAIFFEIENEESHLTPIIEHLSQVVFAKSETKLTTSFSLDSLIEGLNRNEFFKYEGSLTTPNCSQSVTWTVFKNPLPITENELLEFRQLKDDHENPLVDNYRKPEPIGSRKILYRSP